MTYAHETNIDVVLEGGHAGTILAPPGPGEYEKAGGIMASAVARAYNGGLGVEPPAGSRGRAPVRGSGRSPPEAQIFSAFGHLT